MNYINLGLECVRYDDPTYECNTLISGGIDDSKE